MKSLYIPVLSASLLCRTGTSNFPLFRDTFSFCGADYCAVYYKKGGFLTLEFVHEILTCDHPSGLSFEAVISGSARFVSLLFIKLLMNKK